MDQAGTESLLVSLEGSIGFRAALIPAPTECEALL